MKQIEALSIAAKFFEDNGRSLENYEEIMDNLVDIMFEMIRQSSENDKHSEALDKIDRFNRIVTHPEAFVNSIFV